jgi:hypothetical protein
VGAYETETSLTVKATSTVDTSKSVTATVTVPPPTVSSVTVSPNTADVERGGTQAFTAEVEGTYNPVQTVTWTLEGGNSPGTAIGSTTGFLKVAAGETATSLTIRATSTFDASKSGTAAVTVVIHTGGGSFTLVDPTDAASGELSGLNDLRPGDSIALTTTEFDTYRWLVDGLIKGIGSTFTLKGSDYSPGIHQISLEVTRKGTVYSKSGAFTVTP